MSKQNPIISKKRRLLKSISSLGVFKACDNILVNKRAFDMIRISQENDVIWKKALSDKEEQVQDTSIDKWLGKISSVLGEYKFVNDVINRDIIVFYCNNKFDFRVLSRIDWKSFECISVHFQLNFWCWKWKFKIKLSHEFFFIF